MMSAPANDRTVNNYDFKWAVGLIRRSGIATRLEAWNDEDGFTKQVPYPVETVLVTMLLLIAENKEIQWKEAAQLVTVRLSDAQLHELGIYHRVNRADRELLRLHAEHKNVRASALKANDRSYMAFKRSAEAMLEPVDGSPFKGRRRKRFKSREARAIQKQLTSTHRLKHERLHEVLNAFVKASIHPVLTEGWSGSLLVDTTIIPATRNTRRYDDDRGSEWHGPDPDSNWWHKDRYHENGVYGYGMTIAKTAPMADLDGVSLSVGVAWHQPHGGSTESGMKAIDGGRASGALAPKEVRPKEKHRVLVVDMGFSEKLDFKPQAHERGYQVVHDYPKDRKNKPTDLGSGVTLFRGAPFCVGALFLVHEYQAMATKGVSPEVLHAKLAEIEQFTMVRRGLPQPKARRSPGRPRKGSQAVEIGHQVTFRCPASAGRVFCPLACAVDTNNPDARRAALAREKNAAQENGVPIMPTPPTPVEAPAVCQQDSTTFLLDNHKYKQWQVAMVGSKKQVELTAKCRPADEAFHGYMKSGVGRQLREHRFLMVNGTALAIFSAMVVAAVNQDLLEAHDLHELFDPPSTENHGAVA